MSDIINRRTFLQLSGMTLAVGAWSPAIARVRSRGGRPSILGTQLGGGKTLVILFQRGGCDGLNCCIPIEAGEFATYQTYRGTLALGMSDLAATPLDANFALHPRLAEIHALFQQGKVAVLPNVHYDNGSRSHFDSQAFYENGTPFTKTTPDGWLTRHMQATPGNTDVFRAVSFGSSVPAGFRGQPGALTLSSLSSLRVTGNAARDMQYRNAQAVVYGQPAGTRPYDPEVYKSGLDLLEAMNRVCVPTTCLPATDPTAIYPTGSFATRFKELAQLLKDGSFSIELAEIDQGNYDTHTQQGKLLATDGAHPRNLEEMSKTIGAFYTDLGPTLANDVLTLVVTEFGRTARTNGNGGTDHGSAMCTYVIGGGVVPGVHFGAPGWISLTDLRDNRDLKHSLDYRDVYSEILVRHLGNATPEAVFPGWTYTPVGFL
jgi:uncharacterized protein (DUF1501 family)